MEVEEKYEWERVNRSYGMSLDRLKVSGGYLYRTGHDNSVALCFVSDLDLDRYQSHLRDAYNQGYKDGREDVMIKHQITDSEIVKG